MGTRDEISASQTDMFPIIFEYFSAICTWRYSQLKVTKNTLIYRGSLPVSKSRRWQLNLSWDTDTADTYLKDTHRIGGFASLGSTFSLVAICPKIFQLVLRMGVSPSIPRYLLSPIWATQIFIDHEFREVQTNFKNLTDLLANSVKENRLL